MQRRNIAHENRFCKAVQIGSEVLRTWNPDEIAPIMFSLVPFFLEKKGTYSAFLACRAAASAEGDLTSFPVKKSGKRAAAKKGPVPMSPVFSLVTFFWKRK